MLSYKQNRIRILPLSSLSLCYFMVFIFSMKISKKSWSIENKVLHSCQIYKLASFRMYLSYLHQKPHDAVLLHETDISRINKLFSQWNSHFQRNRAGAKQISKGWFLSLPQALCGPFGDFTDSLTNVLLL